MYQKKAKCWIRQSQAHLNSINVVQIYNYQTNFIKSRKVKGKKLEKEWTK